MKLFSLGPDLKSTYRSECFGCMVIAEHEDEARNYLSNMFGDEWLNNKLVFCKEIDPKSYDKTTVLYMELDEPLESDYGDPDYNNGLSFLDEDE